MQFDVRLIEVNVNPSGGRLGIDAVQEVAPSPHSRCLGLHFEGTMDEKRGPLFSLKALLV